MRTAKFNKRQVEETQLRHFLKNEKLALGVLGLEGGQDPPDFVINIANKVISVEITRLVNSPLKEKEQFRNRIISEAERLFRGKYNVDLYCLITFHNIRLDGRQQMFREFSEMLFFEVERIYLLNKGNEFDVTVKWPEFNSRFIERLSVRNTMGFNHWQHFSAYKIDRIAISNLASIIRKKEDDIVRYDRIFDENWLLLVSNEGTKSSANNFDFLDFKSIVTKFHHVYVYKEREDEIVIIK